MINIKYIKWHKKVERSVNCMLPFVLKKETIIYLIKNMYHISRSYSLKTDISPQNKKLDSGWARARGRIFNICLFEILYFQLHVFYIYPTAYIFSSKIKEQK